MQVNSSSAGQIPMNSRLSQPWLQIVNHHFFQKNNTGFSANFVGGIHVLAVLQVIFSLISLISLFLEKTQVPKRSPSPSSTPSPSLASDSPLGGEVADRPSFRCHRASADGSGKHLEAPEIAQTFSGETLGESMRETMIYGNNDNPWWSIDNPTMIIIMMTWYPTMILIITCCGIYGIMV